MSSTLADPKSIADLLPRTSRRDGDRIAVRHRTGEGWRDVSYTELAKLVREAALGLLDLGVGAGERVAILAKTRAEWTYADLAATAVGAVVVPIYPTNSVEECEWVLRDSEAATIVCEDAEQLAKVKALSAPALLRIITIEPVAGVLSFAELAERGRDGDVAELDRRAQAIAAEDPYTFIYTSGTTGPPKGCVLSHGNFRAVLDTVREHDLLSRGDDVSYLYLPLAHALALIMQLASIQAGGTIVYSGGDTRALLSELAEVAPTFLPSVPRVFEKVYAAVTRDLGPMALRDAVRIGSEVEGLRRSGAEVPDQLLAAYEQLDEHLFSRVRGAFGGRLRLAITGAAPIAPEILDFLWACGVPVMEGYGMTETASAISIGTIDAHVFGTVGRPLPGVEVRIAEDGEILVRGENVFAGYHNDADNTSFGGVADGWLHTGDLGTLDAEGFLSITGRKKDIIITAGGKNIAPANLENDLKRSPWISQAVMHGDRRPYPVVIVTLDEEAIGPWAQEHGLPRDLRALARHPQVIALVQGELDAANRKYAQVEQAKRFVILDRDLSQETGELTPTLKVKRDVVERNHAAQLDALYGA
jgi:long-chain acyl-CoA synthetase